MKILVADSGSTKTDWALVVDGVEQLRMGTQGINPVHQDAATVQRILNDELLPQLAGREVDNVCFYGSGVRADLEAFMCELLEQCLKTAGRVEAHSDLLGAARALCGREEGLACILGTGANSCYYDGTAIAANTPALGYILGDEGGGAYLGRRLLNGLYKGWLPDVLRRAFEEETGLALADVITHVYRQPMPNRWLASLAPFVRRYIEAPALSEMVEQSFVDFLQINVLPYRREDLTVGAVGSIAWHFSPQWHEALGRVGLRPGRILRSPIEGLVGYHAKG